MTDLTISVNYAGYVETAHNVLLTQTRHRVASLVPELDDGDSYALSTPYDDYTGVDANVALFGTGYLIDSFPSLYDMFGKFMAGFDIEVPWGRIFGRIVTREESDNAVAEEMKQADDDMVKGEMMEYQVGMRTINAVPTSSFVVGRSIFERNRLMLMARIGLEKKADLLWSVGKEFGSSLSWAKKIITGYAEIMQDYYLGKTDLDGAYYDAVEKKALWPFYVFDFERANIGAMQKAKVYKYMPDRERSDVSKGLLVASYVATGASYGAQFGGGYGAIIGGVIGLLLGLAMVFLE